jgi:hypothetical protein
VRVADAGVVVVDTREVAGVRGEAATRGVALDSGLVVVGFFTASRSGGFTGTIGMIVDDVILAFLRNKDGAVAMDS